METSRILKLYTTIVADALVGSLSLTMFFNDPIPLPDMPELSTLDLHFARFICSLAHNDAHRLFLAAALASNAVYCSHVCCDLAAIAEQMPLLYAANKQCFDNVPDWISFLATLPVVGSPGQSTPLILVGTRLYLHRYFVYEQNCASYITRRSTNNMQLPDPDTFKNALDLLFPPSDADDMQKLAALTACYKNIAIISGGPGTGKTTTVAKILALLLLCTPGTLPRIALAAPTGKAAARMKQSITASLVKLPLPESIRNAFPQEASTIHRLLGVIRNSPHFNHTAKNQLPYDVVVIDEGSMVDLALMSKLFAALPLTAKCVLLGDRNQLASVEAGAVMGDICDTGSDHNKTAAFCSLIAPYCTLPVSGQYEPPLADCIVELTRNYRFSEQSGINSIGHLVMQGKAEEAWSSLTKQQFSDCTLTDVPVPAAAYKNIGAKAEHYYSTYLKAQTPLEALKAFDDFRVLCAVRKGPYGVEAINTAIEQFLAEKNIIRPVSEWYNGRPIMITSNNYELNLFNGDIGIIMHDPASDNELRAFFADESTAGYKSLLPQRLPPHETVYAMTVHKSQGSEFNRVLLVLPVYFSQVLSRELIYTGITRAKKHCELWSIRDVFIKAVSAHTIRMSGLRDALWKMGQ